MLARVKLLHFSNLSYQGYYFRSVHFFQVQITRQNEKALEGTTLLIHHTTYGLFLSLTCQVAVTYTKRSPAGFKNQKFEFRIICHLQSQTILFSRNARVQNIESQIIMLQLNTSWMDNFILLNFGSQLIFRWLFYNLFKSW